MQKIFNLLRVNKTKQNQEKQKLLKIVKVKKKGLYPESLFIPDGVKANCYLFALAPKVGLGGYANRVSKSRPGDKCKHNRQKPMSFTDCRDINTRVQCDNKEPYVKKLSDKFSKVDMMKIKTNSDNHLMIAVLSPGNHGTSQDFHFLRRVNVYDINKTILKKILMNTPSKCRTQLNRYMNNGGSYVWFHQRGWSDGGPLMYDAKENLIIDPSKSNFNYGRLNYSTKCGLFQVRSREATVNNRFNSKSNVAVKKMWL